MSSVRLIVLALGLVAVAGVLSAQSTTPPLAESVKELQDMKSPASSQRLPGTGRAAFTLPSLTTSPVEIGSPRVMGPGPRQESSKLKPQQTNWLVDGVKQLEKRQKNRSAGDNLSESPSTTLSNGTEVTDRDSALISTYADEEQREAARNDEEPSIGAGSRTDAFAPFLARWLSDSPVEGEFFNKFVQGNETVSVPMPANATGAQSSDAFRPTPDGAMGSPTADKMENPYLAAAGAWPAAPAPRTSLVADSNNRRIVEVPAAASSHAPDVTISPELPPASSPAKNALPNIPDDKKYFPQQRKF